MIDSGLLHVGYFFIGLEFVALSALVGIASLYDIKSRRIPNWLIAIGIISSLCFHMFSGYGYGFTFWATGLLVGFLFFLPLYVMRAMGAGDVKLMAAVGSFVGGIAAFQTVILTLLAGGVMALLVVLWNRSWKLVSENLRLIITSMTISVLTTQLPKAEAPVKSAGSLPYGVAIATGTLLYICFFRP